MQSGRINTNVMGQKPYNTRERERERPTTIDSTFTLCFVPLERPRKTKGGVHVNLMCSMCHFDPLWISM